MAAATVDPRNQPPVVASPVPLVYRLTNGLYQFLPNVRCESITHLEGPDPGHAQFSYIFADSGPLAGVGPSRVEQVLGVGPGSFGTVRSGDRLVVMVPGPSGRPFLAWDGFISIPEGELTANSEHAGFSGIATPGRCKDTLIRDAYYRDGADPSNTAKSYQTALRINFNPDAGRDKFSDKGVGAGGNRCATGTEVTNGNFTYPVFLDDAHPLSEKWTLADAVKYILAVHNDQTFVLNPNFDEVTRVLNAIEPSTAGGKIDLNDPATFTSKPIYCQDEDVTGVSWPQAVHGLIERHGFTIIWSIGQNRATLPTWRFSIVRVDDAARLFEKTIGRQPAGAQLDVGLTQAEGVRIGFDTTGVVNSYAIRAAPTFVEVSLMLAPLFPISANDALAANLPNFKKGAPGFDAVRTLYRLFGLDELGEGHWSFASNAWVKVAPDLSRALAPLDAKGQRLPFPARYRPGKRTLMSKGSDGQFNKMTLSWILVTDYAGAVPGIWDGTASTKFNRVNGDYQLEDDICAITINCDDPSRWAFSDHKDAPRGGVLAIPEALASSPASPFRFHLRLTTILETDNALTRTAPKRPSIPGYEVQGFIDAKDRYQLGVIKASSEFNLLEQDVNANDPTAEMDADAAARQYQSELPVYMGPISIPWFSGAYQIGDRIKGVTGRNITFSPPTNGDSETPRYPRVTMLRWVFEPRPMTELTLSDQRITKRKK